MVFGNLMHKIQ